MSIIRRITTKDLKINTYGTYIYRTIVDNRCALLYTIYIRTYRNPHIVVCMYVCMVVCYFFFFLKKCIFIKKKQNPCICSIQHRATLGMQRMNI